jgi:hypothetical protein
MWHLTLTLGIDVCLLARHPLPDPSAGPEYMTLFLIFVASIIIAIAIILMRPRKCGWCGNNILYSSETKEKSGDRVFCSLKCLLKYENEIADLEDRRKSAGKSTNININDRNKYL